MCVPKGLVTHNEAGTMHISARKAASQGVQPPAHSQAQSRS